MEPEVSPERDLEEAQEVGEWKCTLQGHQGWRAVGVYELDWLPKHDELSVEIVRCTSCRQIAITASIKDYKANTPVSCTEEQKNIILYLHPELKQFEWIDHDEHLSIPGRVNRIKNRPKSRRM